MNALRRTYVIQKIISSNYPTTCSVRKGSSKPPEKVYSAKNYEVPIVAVTEKENVDIIGPPDPVSNLRPVIRRQVLHETPLQRKLRRLQDETHQFNQKFWTEHNTKFIQEKQKYVTSHPKSSGTALTSDEMSEFYRRFLDENWERHVMYNFQWYRRNVEMVMLTLRVNIQNLMKKS